MLSFVHVSTTSVEKSDLSLQSHQSYRKDDGGTPAKNGKGKYTVYSRQELTVPLTSAELASLDDGPVVSIKLGDKKHDVCQKVADYLVGRKLRSNQEMQALLGEGGVTNRRDATYAWFMSQGGENVAEAIRRLKAKKSDPKAYNAWLDGIYAENSDEIDAYAEQQ